MAGDGGSRRRPRIALVLGSGGIVGGAYHAGALKALYDTWGIDARTVELIVGTSAGSIAGSLIAAGLHPNDMFRRETGTSLSPAGAAVLSRARARRGAPPITMSTVGAPAAPEVVLRAMVNPGRVAAGSVAAGLMPRGIATTDHVTGMVEGLLGQTWPDRPRLRISAVELSTARRVVFGPDDDIDDLDQRAIRVRTEPGKAVAASCAVPTVFQPVAIEGRDHLDGGVHSADNLDLIGTSSFDLVIVSSPSTSLRPLSGGLPLLGLRELSRVQTDRERRSLTQVCRVEVLRPTPKDLEAMGSNMFDAKRRPAVAFQAHTSVSAHLSRLPHPGRPPTRRRTDRASTSSKRTSSKRSTSAPTTTRGATAANTSTRTKQGT